MEQFVPRFLANPAAGGFLLDFDGTLSEIVSRPSGVAPAEGAVELLESLAALYRTVALLSGRRAEDLYDIVKAKGIRYLGVYGGEEFQDGRLVQPPEAERWRGMASRLARDAEALIHTQGITGAEVEYKDIAVSFHFRNAESPDAATIIQRWCEEATAKRGFESNLGRMVVEMRPKGISKAFAVRKVIEDGALQSLVVAGDDAADVPALALAGELLGDRAFRIGVASDEEPEGLRAVSDVVAESPADVVDLLSRFLETL